MKRCDRCGREIGSRTWYWYRRIREDGKLKTERFCWDCAASMIDEHYTNGLIHAFNK